ncbi:Hypothetical_protein [Hexamita inflata]|uniref:Hypothetical_protein n=1 Tax=Hexamita inflata TaxID=28002 RepID=A0AA86VID4_9EUKA|nr:Hypothetical protein HINF_LOCUS55233 [Hexamita inflata]
MEEQDITNFLMFKYYDNKNSVINQQMQEILIDQYQQVNKEYYQQIAEKTIINDDFDEQSNSFDTDSSEKSLAKQEESQNYLNQVQEEQYKTILGPFTSQRQNFNIIDQFIKEEISKLTANALIKQEVVTKCNQFCQTDVQNQIQEQGTQKCVENVNQSNQTENTVNKFIKEPKYKNQLQPVLIMIEKRYKK